MYIPHELKLAVWRDKADWPITIELAQSHALMELAIIKLHRRVRFGCLLTAPSMAISNHIYDPTTMRYVPFLEHQLIVETEFTFRSATQIRPHENLAVHVCSQNGSYGQSAPSKKRQLKQLTFFTHQHINGLDNVDKRFVLPILDIRASPRCRSCCLNGDLGRVFAL